MFVCPVCLTVHLSFYLLCIYRCPLSFSLYVSFSVGLLNFSLSHHQPVIRMFTKRTPGRRKSKKSEVWIKRLSHLNRSLICIFCVVQLQDAVLETTSPAPVPPEVSERRYHVRCSCGKRRVRCPTDSNQKKLSPFGIFSCGIFFPYLSSCFFFLFRRKTFAVVSAQAQFLFHRLGQRIASTPEGHIHCAMALLSMQQRRGSKFISGTCFRSRCKIEDGRRETKGSEGDLTKSKIIRAPI